MFFPKFCNCAACVRVLLAFSYSLTWWAPLRAGHKLRIFGKAGKFGEFPQLSAVFKDGKQQGLWCSLCSFSSDIPCSLCDFLSEIWSWYEKEGSSISGRATVSHCCDAWDIPIRAGSLSVPLLGKISTSDSMLCYGSWWREHWQGLQIRVEDEALLLRFPESVVQVEWTSEQDAGTFILMVKQWWRGVECED